MKKKASATLGISRTLLLVVLIISCPILLAICIPPVSSSTFVYALLSLAGIVSVGFLADHLSAARITLSDTDVQLRVRRTGKTVSLPWTDFTCLYELDGWKMKFYLLTPIPMDKDAQLAAYKACCKNKDVPYTHEGCLILNAYAYGNVIDQYIPAHLKKMPWINCAKI